MCTPFLRYIEKMKHVSVQKSDKSASLRLLLSFFSPIYRDKITRFIMHCNKTNITLSAFRFPKQTKYNIASELYHVKRNLADSRI